MAMQDDEEKRSLRAALEKAENLLRVHERTATELAAAKEALETRTKELALSLSMMRATLESTTDGILVTDIDGHVTGYNQRFVQMWRIPRELMDRGDHLAILEAASRQVRDPQAYLDEIEEIYRNWSAETFDVVELTDGRAFERISKIQYVAEQSVGRVWNFRDITARRQAARILREQREWFEVTLASIGDAVITTDTAANVTFLNPVAEQMTGWKLAEAVRQPLRRVFNIVNETTRAPAEDPIGEVLEHGLTVGLANHTALISRDGTETAIEDSAAPIRDAAGKLVGAVMVFHDVTERRRTEGALRISHAQFSAIIHQSPIGMYLVDSTLRFRHVNAKAEPIFGRADQLIGQSMEEVLHTMWPRYTAEEMTGRFRQTLLTGEPYGSRTFSEMRTDRHVREYYDWEIHRVTLPDGQHGVACYFIDIAEHVLAQEKLRKLADEQKRTAEALREEYTIVEELNAVSRALASELDLTRIAQIVINAGTRITGAECGAFFDSRAKESSEARLVHASCGESPRNTEDFASWSAALISEPTFRHRGVIRIGNVAEDTRYDGSSIARQRLEGKSPVASYLAVPVISRSGELLGGLSFGHAAVEVFTARDEQIVVAIAAQASAAMDTARLYETEQQARTAAELARNAAEQANRAKDDFLAALSHELRTPLTPVLAILTSLGEDSATPAIPAGDLGMMRRNVELEARLIDDLLDLTRITRGKLELHWEQVELGQLLENALNTCLPDISAKRISVRRELAGLPQTIWADGARVTQILWNVIKNAVKFTPEGGTITLRSGLETTDHRRRFFIECEDTGIGIEAHQIDGIFAAFEQGSRTITKQFGGLGLGLAISKAIAEAHEGTISARSPGAGKGSTFRITLPCVVATNGSLPSKLSVDGASRRGGEKVATATTRPRPRILLVEDHEDTATVLSRMLGRAGYDVMHAASVAESQMIAAREMQGAGITLIVSDLGLPDGSGIDLMRTLADKYDLVGIALSGFGMESDRERSKAAGFSRHLTKPVDANVLRGTIAELVREIESS